MRQETWDRKRETGDVRQETWDKRRESEDVSQDTWDRRRETGDITGDRRHDTRAWYKRLRDRRHDTRAWYKRLRDRRQVHLVTKCYGRDFLRNTAQLRNFWMARIVFPKMWRGGAKIKWRGAAVALMRWRENLSWNNGAAVWGRKDLKSGEKI